MAENSLAFIEEKKSIFIDPDYAQEAATADKNEGFVDPDDMTSKMKAYKEAHPEEFDVSFTDSLKEGGKNFLIGAGKGFTEAGRLVKRGAIKAGEQLGINAEGSLKEYDTQLQTERADEEMRLNQLPEDFSATRKAGEIVGEAAPFTLVPGGTAGKLATRIATGAAAGAGIGYLSDNTLLGGIIGGGIPALLGGAKGLLSTIFPGKGKVLSNIQSEIGRQGNAKSIQKTLDAAKRLDVNLSPGEATGSKILKSEEQGATFLRRNLRQKLADVVDKRSQILESKTQKVIQDVVPEGRAAAKLKAAQIREQVDKVLIPKESLKKLQQNPIINDALTKASKSSEYRPDLNKLNTVGRFRAVKKVLEAQENAARTARDFGAAKNISDARKQLVNTLDDVAPAYKESRQISQRLAIQDTFYSEVDKIAVKMGEESPTLSQVANKLWGTTKKKTEFLRAISQAGGDVQQAKDMMRILKAVEKSPLDAVVAKQTGMKAIKGAGQGIIEVGLELTNRMRKGWYNKALLNTMLDPKWATEVSKMASNPKVIVPTMNKILASQLPQEENISIETASPDLITVDPDDVKEPMPQNPPAAQPVVEALPQLQAEIAPAAVQNSGEERVQQLLNMSPDDYYNEMLNTPEKQMQFLQNVIDAGGDGGTTAKLLYQLNRANLQRDNIQMPAQEGNIKGLFIGALIMTALSALAGGKGAGQIRNIFMPLIQQVMAKQQRNMDEYNEAVLKNMKDRERPIMGLLSQELKARTS